MMKPPVIIIGMHRSGTTLLAETLNKAGVFMGAFRDHNGEALHFLSLNQQMLQGAGGDWLHPLEPAGVNEKMLNGKLLFAEHIKSSSLKRARLHYNMKWGWKDPRNTFTLKWWLQCFPNARVLHLIRDGRAVALSLKKRNAVPGEVHHEGLNNLAFNFKLWEQYVAQGLSFRALNKQYLEVNYEFLLQRDRQTLARIASFVKVEISDHLVIKGRSNDTYSEELNQLARESTLFQQLPYTL
jgi:hypothetical protein